MSQRTCVTIQIDFSPKVQAILSRFDLDNEITRLHSAKILYQVVGKFAAMRDLDKAQQSRTWAMSSRR